MAKVTSVNISKQKGTPKDQVAQIELVAGLGVKGDAHAAPGDRQLSLLSEESLEKARKSFAETKGCEALAGEVELRPGIFAENITVSGLDLLSMKVGDELRVGPEARIRLTRIGKDCHRRCSIYYKVGDCIMPAEGVFFEVVEGGVVKPGDDVENG